MFWDILGVSIAVISIGGTISALAIAVAMLKIADAKLQWVRLRREMFEDDAVTAIKNKFKRSVKK
jgi:hypothetical protein